MFITPPLHQDTTETADTRHLNQRPLPAQQGKVATWSLPPTIPRIAGNAAGHRALGTTVDPAPEHQKFQQALPRYFWCSGAGSTVVPGARCPAALLAM